MEYMLASSRHHLLPIRRASRPDRDITSIFLFQRLQMLEVYAESEEGDCRSEYPFFDGNALDAARFIFGADCEEVIGIMMAG